MIQNFLCRSIVAGHLHMLIVVLMLAIVPVAEAQDIANHPYLSSSQIQLNKALQTPAIEVPQAALSKNLELISSVLRIPIWMDREVAKDHGVGYSKVDDGSAEVVGSPAKKIGFSTQITQLEVLKNWAQSAGAELIVTEGIVAFVPRQKIDLIESSIWSYHTQKGFVAWNKIVPEFSWDTGASMRSVASDWSQIVSADSDWCRQLPHDIWSGFRFEKVKQRTIAACLLTSIGSIAVLQANTNQIEVLDWDLYLSTNPEQVVWKYSQSDIKRLGVEHCRTWKEQFPASVITRSDQGDWVIRALPREHRALVAPLLPKESAIPQAPRNFPPTRSPGAKAQAGKEPIEKQYSGQMRGTLGQAIASMEASLQIQFDVSQVNIQVLNREIDIEYRNVPLLNLLQMIAEDAKVSIDRAGQDQYLILDVKPN